MYLNICRKEKNRLSTDFQCTIRDERGLRLSGAESEDGRDSEKPPMRLCVSYWCVTNYHKVGGLK